MKRVRLFLFLFLPSLFSVRGFVRRADWFRTSVRVNSQPDLVSDLSLADLKAELDRRDVKWRGICFERPELESALQEAREQEHKAGTNSEADGTTATAAADDSTTPTPPPAAADTVALDREAAALSAGRERASKLRVAELRQELASRSIGWADCLEKSELVERLAGVYAKAALFSVSGALEPGMASGISGNELEEELRDGSTPLLLDCYATWCGPCQMLAPQLSQLATDVGTRVRVAKIDTDAEPEMASKLRVQGLPTLIFFRPGGGGGLSEVNRIEGVPGNSDALRELVREYLGV